MHSEHSNYYPTSPNYMPHFSDQDILDLEDMSRRISSAALSVAESLVTHVSGGPAPTATNTVGDAGLHDTEGVTDSQSAPSHASTSNTRRRRHRRRHRYCLCYHFHFHEQKSKFITYL